MKKTELNYIFVFVAIYIAYNIAQVPIIFLKPEWTRYLSVLQILFFIVPLVLIHFNSDVQYRSWKSFQFTYKLHFKFNASFVPAIFWIFCGLMLFNSGLDIVIYNILPDTLRSIWEKIYEFMDRETLNMIIFKEKTIIEFLIVTCCIAVVPSLCEEILFRGYLMQSINIKNGKMKAIIISALVFSAVHLNITGFAGLFIIGFFLGYLVYATGSIVPSMILHFMNNFLIVIAYNYSSVEQFGYRFFSATTGVVMLIIGGGILVLSFLFIRAKQSKLFVNHRQINQ